MPEAFTVDAKDTLTWESFTGWAKGLVDKYGYVRFSAFKDSRSLRQNALQHVIYGVIGKHTGDTDAGVKAYCKLHYGVPIMRRDEKFCRVYDECIKPNLAYEQKLKLMEGEQFPVTSLMEWEPARDYINAILLYGSECGADMSKCGRKHDAIYK